LDWWPSTGRINSAGGTVPISCDYVESWQDMRLVLIDKFRIEERASGPTASPATPHLSPQLLAQCLIVHARYCRVRWLVALLPGGLGESIRAMHSQAVQVISLWMNGEK
jgi:hypothetical protein